MSRARIAIATCAELAELTPDDRPLPAALDARGVEAVPAVWDAEEVEWERFDACLVRSTWDWRCSGRGDAATQGALEELLSSHDVMVQPFLPSVEAEGELSLIYIGGRFSHAVRKLPRDGDFRVQPSWGGSVHSVDASPGEMAIGDLALAQLPAEPLYARADLVRGGGGESLLIELELIEPLLFLDHHLPAVEVMADAVTAQL